MLSARFGPSRHPRYLTPPPPHPCTNWLMTPTFAGSSRDSAARVMLRRTQVAARYTHLPAHPHHLGRRRVSLPAHRLKPVRSCRSTGSSTNPAARTCPRLPRHQRQSARDPTPQAPSITPTTVEPSSRLDPATADVDAASSIARRYAHPVPAPRDHPPPRPSLRNCRTAGPRSLPAIQPKPPPTPVLCISR
jgi:hypothetical protein